MKFKDEATWRQYVLLNRDDYGKTCINVAYGVMVILDNCGDFDAHNLISKVDKELGADLTGFMAGCVAHIVSTCHERGDEFKRSWDSSFINSSGEFSCVIDPAIVDTEFGG